MNIQPQHSYRCTFVPANATLASGVTDTIQLKARDGVEALRFAHKVTGCHVIEAVRIEPQS